MLVLVLPTCLVSSLWFSCGLAVSMGEAAKTCPFVMLPTGWKLPDVSYKMLVLRASHASRLVASRWFSCGVRHVYGGSVSKPVLFEGVQAGCHVVLRGRRGTLWHSNLFDNMSKTVANWRKSRTKCWFFCIHVSCLESLVFLWRRRVYGGSCKTSLFPRFPSRLSCRFAWQACHFVTFQAVW